MIKKLPMIIPSTLLRDGIINIINSVFESSDSDDFNILYNKIWLIYIFFDDKTIYNIFSFISDDDKYNEPMKLLNRNIVDTKKHKKQFKSINIKDIPKLNEIKIKFNNINYTKQSKAREQLKILNEELNVRLINLKKYYDSLSNMHKNNNKNKQKKDEIKKFILENTIPKLKLEISNYNKKINDLTDILNNKTFDYEF